MSESFSTPQRGHRDGGSRGAGMHAWRPPPSSSPPSRPLWRAIGRLQGPFLQKFTTPRIAGRIKNLYECISGDETDEHKIAYTALLRTRWKTS